MNCYLGICERTSTKGIRAKGHFCAYSILILAFGRRRPLHGQDPLPDLQVRRPRATEKRPWHPVPPLFCFYRCCEKNTPPEKKTLGKTSLKNTKSEAGAGVMMLFYKAEARAKGMFLHRHRYVCCSRKTHQQKRVRGGIGYCGSFRATQVRPITACAPSAPAGSGYRHELVIISAQSNERLHSRQGFPRLSTSVQVEGFHGRRHLPKSKVSTVVNICPIQSNTQVSRVVDI